MVKPMPRGNRTAAKNAAIEAEFIASGDFLEAAKPVVIVAAAQPAPTLLPAEKDWDLALAQVKPVPALTAEVLDDLLFVAHNPRLAERLGTTTKLISAGVYEPVGSTVLPDPDKIVLLSPEFSGRYDRGSKFEKPRKSDEDRNAIIRRSKFTAPGVDL